MYSKQEILSALELAYEKYGEELTAEKFNEDEIFFSHMVVVNEFGSWSAGLNEIDKSDGIDCPNCGKHFEVIGRHWKKDCKYPKVTKKQKDVLVGGLMSDASFVSDSSIQFSSTNKDFLKWVCRKLGWLSTSSGVKTKNTSEENFESSKRYFGKEKVSSPDNYSDSYYLRTREHPKIAKMKEKWYKNKEKRYPKSISLTPTSGKIWYVGDGGLNYGGRGRKTPNIQIGSENEKNRPELLRNLLQEKGFSPKVSDYIIYLPSSETEKFLDWIGEPIPGFEYKWETDYQRYQKSKP